MMYPAVAPVTNNSTRNRGGVTACWEVEALEVIAICHISVLSRYGPAANHKVLAIVQIESALLGN